MKCILCKKDFYERRTFINLFKEEKGYVCNRCYKKYPIELEYESFELENYNCLVVSMFKYNYKINYDAFIFEYQKIYKRLNELNDSTVLFFDYIDLNYNLELINLYANLLENNIIILTFNMRK